MSGSIGFMYRPRPFESLSLLSPLICDVFDTFYRYGTLIPLSPCHWRDWRVSFQLNCRFALRPRFNLQRECSRGESTGSRRHVDGANLQLQGQQGTGTWLPRYSHWLTSACCSGCEYGEHGEHSGQVRWTAGVIAPPVSVYYW